MAACKPTMSALWSIVVVMVLTVGAWTVPVKRVAAEEPSPDSSVAQYEIRFMEDMIDHHMMAVLMAQLCEDRAVNEELLMMCQQIAATQTAEIEEMQAWLEDWYSISYEPEMTKRMQRPLEELASMSGAEFEIAFMTMMIGHHETAVKVGERCVERAYHRDLVELCKDIVEAQTMEIVIMESWLCDWYGICDEE